MFGKSDAGTFIKLYSKSGVFSQQSKPMPIFGNSCIGLDPDLLARTKTTINNNFLKCLSFDQKDLIESHCYQVCMS